MKTVFELCKPRASVFADTTRDDVLNLSDLIKNKIDEGLVGLRILFI